MKSPLLPNLTLSLLTIALSLCAVAQPDSTYLVNDSVFIKASPRNITSSFNFDPVSFDVNYNYRTGRNGGIIGGSGYFRGRVTVAPQVKFDTTSRYLTVSLDVKGELLEHRSPGGFGEFPYQLAAQDVSYADQKIRQMKIFLGKRDTVVEIASRYTRFKVPDDVTRFNGIEVLYDGTDVKVRKRIFFGKTGDFDNSSALPWIIPVVIAGAFVAYAVKKSGDKKKKSWIEIVLVDRNNKPVENESCTITLPDGSTWSGKTDSAGKLRLQGIPQGMCRISFPNIDGSEWSASTGTASTEKIET